MLPKWYPSTAFRRSVLMHRTYWLANGLFCFTRVVKFGWNAFWKLEIEARHTVLKETSDIQLKLETWLPKFKGERNIKSSLWKVWRLFSYFPAFTLPFPSYQVRKQPLTVEPWALVGPPRVSTRPALLLLFQLPILSSYIVATPQILSSYEILAGLSICSSL